MITLKQVMNLKLFIRPLPHLTEQFPSSVLWDVATPVTKHPTRGGKYRRGSLEAQRVRSAQCAGGL